MQSSQFNQAANRGRKKNNRTENPMLSSLGLSNSASGIGGTGNNTRLRRSKERNSNSQLSQKSYQERLENPMPKNK